MNNPQNTQPPFNWFNFWTIAIAIMTMLITAHGIEKNHEDVEKSLSKTDSSIVIAREQFEFSKKQNEDATKEAIEQNRLQKLQFENQLSEWKKQADASIKQVNYQIKAQRPYLDNSIKPLNNNEDYLFFCYQNNGARPANNSKTHILIIDSTFSEILYKSMDRSSSGALIKDVIDCEQLSMSNILSHAPNVKILYFYVIIEYYDGITHENFTQSFCKKWHKGGLNIGSNVLIFNGKDWEKGKIENLLMKDGEKMKRLIKKALKS